MGRDSVKERNASTLYRVLAVLFSAFIALMFGNTLFANITLSPRFETGRMLIFLGFAACALLLLAVCIRLIPQTALCILAVLACLCVFVLQIWFTRATYTLYGWDCGSIVLGAGELQDGWLRVPTYFAQYPNNEALLLFFERVFSLSHAAGITNDPLIASLVAVLLTDTAIALGFLCARRLLSREGAYLYLALSAFMVGMNMWAQVPYTDTCGMFFPPLLLYLWLRVRSSSRRSFRLVLCCLMGFLSLLAMKTKPQGLILSIAVVLIEMTANPFSRASVSRLARGGACALCGLLAASALFTAYRDAKLSPYITPEMRERYQFPVTQQLMMGAEKRKVQGGLFSYGAWDSEDVSSTAALPTLKERTVYTLGEYVQRVKDFGLPGYLRFLYEKSCWIYADGTFFYGAIDGFRYTGKPPVRTKLSRVFQSIAYEDLPGYQKNFAYFAQGFWLLTLALCVVSLWGKESHARAFAVVRLALLGLTLSILLFEGRSRYLLLYLPLFTLIAAKGAETLYAAALRRKHSV